MNFEEAHESKLEEMRNVRTIIGTFRVHQFEPINSLQ